MKIISWNVNGLRAVYKRDFLKWLKKKDADMVCLQEIKCNQDQVSPNLLNHENYNFYFNSAEKPGYSGVAIFTKKKPLKINKKLGHDRFDMEGRMLHLEFQNFSLINLYLPHGGRKKENLEYKLEVYEALFEYLKRLKNKNIILIGDFNIAHDEIDLARPKNNKNNIMFTPEERSKLDELIRLGYLDTFREFNKESGNFTWWPYFSNARERNLGWRIDYSFIAKNLKLYLKNAFILKDDKGSDHCPVGIEINL